MTSATAAQRKPATLDSLYALIRGDLTRVDSTILTRVKNEAPLIHDIAQHIIASGGKRIRPALTLISAQACNYSGEHHIGLAAAIELIHTATLLHDDVVDESKLRRGVSTANDVFGNKASILVGDFLLGQAFQLMVADGGLKGLTILADVSAIISRGEVLQLMTEGAPDTSIEDYLQVVSCKTAVLFAAACELGAVVAGREEYEEPLRNFGTQLGYAFQLADDVLDYAAVEADLGKTIGDDFREGKITLPVIIAYGAGNAEEKSFWKRTLSDLDQTPEDFDKARRLMSKHGALAQSMAMANSYCNKARAALAGFAPGAAKSAMLDIVEFCAGRTY